MFSLSSISIGLTSVSGGKEVQINRNEWLNFERERKQGASI
jgi:hypothetical protein